VDASRVLNKLYGVSASSEREGTSQSILQRPKILQDLCKVVLGPPLLPSLSDPFLRDAIGHDSVTRQSPGIVGFIIAVAVARRVTVSGVEVQDFPNWVRIVFPNLPQLGQNIDCVWPIDD